MPAVYPKVPDSESWVISPSCETSLAEDRPDPEENRGTGESKTES